MAGHVSKGNYNYHSQELTRFVLLALQVQLLHNELALPRLPERSCPRI